jgi:hypothetical protein
MAARCPIGSAPRVLFLVNTPTLIPASRGVRRGFADSMLWFFERNEEQVKLETRFDNDAQEYVAILRWPDGREQEERSSTAAAFRSRLLELERQLEIDRWRRTGPMIVLPDGWPDKRPLE